MYTAILKKTTSRSFKPFGWKVSSSYYQNDYLFLRSTLPSDWSVNLTSQSPSHLLIPSAKWVWNYSCLTFMYLKTYPQVIWTSSILLVTSFAKYQINYIPRPINKIFCPNLICAFCTKSCKSCKPGKSHV